VFLSKWASDSFVVEAANRVVRSTQQSVANLWLKTQRKLSKHSDVNLSFIWYWRYLISIAYDVYTTELRNQDLSKDHFP
jgi:hypothetical protein